MKKFISLFLAVLCLISAFTFCLPAKVDAAAPKVTSTSGFGFTFHKDIGRFGDDIRVNVSRSNNKQYYAQVSYRINGGSWYTYDANKILSGDYNYIGIGQYLKNKPTKIEYRVRTYQIENGARVYSAWSGIQTYKLTWSKPWYQFYSDVSICHVNRGITKKYHTYIK